MPSKYFESHESAAYANMAEPPTLISLIANRYIGANPAEPPVWRVYDARGISTDAKARSIFDFGERFPGARPGDAAWAVGDLWCRADRESNFQAACKGPVRIYVNGALVFASAGAQESSHDTFTRFPVSLRAGRNRFAIRCECTRIGFGCALANAMPQWEPCHYIMPFAAYNGESGFAYTNPTADDAALCALLAADENVSDAAFEAAEWNPPHVRTPQGPRAVYDESTGVVYAWAAFEADRQTRDFVSAKSPAVRDILVDGRPYTGGEVSAGDHDMLVCLDASADTPDFVALSRDIALKPPFYIKGNTSPWLYAGAFDAPPPDPERLTDISRPFEARGGLSFWKTQFAGVSPRLFIESELYGRWTYPLGVTLYGMLRAGERLGNSTYIDYVMSHVATPVDHDAYALYEKQAYGFPGLNEQLCWLDALDDCGSFGSLMLECDARCPNPRAEAIAERIADYILNKQERMPDGAFQRHGSTIWADDMYMSVPFLVRYALRTNMPRALDEACAQLLLYRKYLFMPEKSILSHMRSLRHGRTDGLDGTPNGIPWCRGNGWVFFSLSELLPRIGGSASDAKDAPEQREAAPRAREAHPARAELIDFYNSLVGGYLALQGEHGLWHQILDDPESYEESSTTAMFICALVRGCVDGFISREYESAAIRAARRAWRAIAERAVDRKGNLYGVCRGSGFSFSRAYYRALSWNFNDTHGIGIVMLAGVEIMRLAEWLRDGGARA